MKSSPFFRSALRHSRHGFTLMEMIIVLAIIALLMGMVIFQLGDFRGAAEEQRVQADLLTFKEELIAYQLESGSLPTTEQGLKALWVKPTIEPIPQHWRAFATEETRDPWGHPYQYRTPAKKSTDEYDLFSMGPDGQPDTADDMGNWKSTSSSSSNP